jgi:hypothetical protein
MDRTLRIGVLVVAALFPAYLIGRSHNLGPDLGIATPVEAGLLGLFSLYLFYVAVMGEWGIWNAARGKDGRASTSKFQALLWTVAVIFAYIAVLDARWIHGYTEVLATIPPNLLVALGISVVTTTGAAAVTASNVDSGKQLKPTKKNQGLAPIFQNDDDQPDLGKIQLVAFTFVAIAVFLGAVFQELALIGTGTGNKPADSLPDIDASLMALMGLGSAVYLGGKLVTTATPFLSALSKPGLSVAGSDDDRKLTISGLNLGAGQAGNQVWVDGVALQAPATEWSDTSITVVIPTKKPDGSAWTTGKTVDVLVVSGGRSSANSLKLRLDP